MKKNWRLQCLICKHSRKTGERAVITCVKKVFDWPVYYGSDMFTGFISCSGFEEMQDPFKKPRLGDRHDLQKVEK